MSKRTFIALPVDAEKLSSEIDFFRKNIHGLNVKWVEPENLHLTLAFLGDTAPEQIEAVKKCLAQITGETEAFRLTFTGAGAFRSMHSPQVLWIGIEPNDRLHKLYQEIQKFTMSLGFEPENRPFQPHLTIGRVKGFAQEHNLSSLINSRDKLNISIEADTLIYYESILMPAGPVYKAIGVYGFSYVIR